MEISCVARSTFSRLLCCRHKRMRQQDCLVQLQNEPDRTERAIGYCSRSLNDTERAYDTKHRQCHAVLQAVLLLRPHLEACWFSVRLHFDALKWMLNLTDFTGRLPRWWLHIYRQDYDVLNDGRGTGIPAVYAIATYRGTDYEKRLLTVQDFIHE